MLLTFGWIEDCSAGQV